MFFFFSFNKACKYIIFFFKLCIMFNKQSLIKAFVCILVKSIFSVDKNVMDNLACLIFRCKNKK